MKGEKPGARPARPQRPIRVFERGLGKTFCKKFAPEK